MPEARPHPPPVADEPRASCPIRADHSLSALAGRELDALVAEEVMSDAMTATALKDGELLGLDFDTEDWHVVPHYSTDIAAAWSVVEHWNATHPDEFQMMAEQGGWTVDFSDRQGTSVWAATASLAICRAALVAAYAGEEL